MMPIWAISLGSLVGLERSGRLRIRIAFQFLGVRDQGARHGTAAPPVPPARVLHELDGSKPRDARRDASAAVLAGGKACDVIWGHGSSTFPEAERWTARRIDVRSIAR
jgi:hypothetical protein